MNGLFFNQNLPLTEKGFKENFSQMEDFHLESIFSDLGKVLNLRRSLRNESFSKEHLELASFQLSSLSDKSIPIYRVEGLLSDQENLKLRCEGVFSYLWEKISKFFRWIYDSIRGLFGKSSTPSKEEVKQKESNDKELEKTLNSLPKAKTSFIKLKNSPLNKVLDTSSTENLKDSFDFFSDSIDFFHKLCYCVFYSFEDFIAQTDKDFRTINYEIDKLRPERIEISNQLKFVPESKNGLGFYLTLKNAGVLVSVPGPENGYELKTVSTTFSQKDEAKITFGDLMFINVKISRKKDNIRKLLEFIEGPYANKIKGFNETLNKLKDKNLSKEDEKIILDKVKENASLSNGLHGMTVKIIPTLNGFLNLSLNDILNRKPANKLEKPNFDQFNQSEEERQRFEQQLRDMEQINLNQIRNADQLEMVMNQQNLTLVI